MQVRKIQSTKLSAPTSKFGVQNLPRHTNQFLKPRCLQREEARSLTCQLTKVPSLFNLLSSKVASLGSTGDSNAVVHPCIYYIQSLSTIQEGAAASVNKTPAKSCLVHILCCRIMPSVYTKQSPSSRASPIIWKHRTMHLHPVSAHPHLVYFLQGWNKKYTRASKPLSLATNALVRTRTFSAQKAQNYHIYGTISRTPSF